MVTRRSTTIHFYAQHTIVFSFLAVAVCVVLFSPDRRVSVSILSELQLLDSHNIR
jgi:hypothetical protein